MNKQLELYHEFIDDLVKIRSCVLARWVKERGWPQLPENEKINKFLAELTNEQKEILADIVQQGRDSGIHDVLVHLTDEVNLNDLRIVKKGIEVAIEPYGTEMYYDWVCRCAGDDWPVDLVGEKYK
jgi:hypothetical protein